VQSPDVVERLGKLGAEPAPAGSSAQFAAMVQADSERWAKVIKDRKIVQE
jgi:tripartite-type tricarboxylate transporter receptor subunit TctC